MTRYLGIATNRKNKAISQIKVPLLSRDLNRRLDIYTHGYMLKSA